MRLDCQTRINHRCLASGKCDKRPIYRIATNTFILRNEHQKVFLKKNRSTPVSFIIYFWSFQTNTITIFTNNLCEKCPSSIWCWDLNPQPWEYESPPITTRPGLPPNNRKFQNTIPATSYSPSAFTSNVSQFGGFTRV